jgi:Baseplate hub gp41
MNTQFGRYAKLYLANDDEGLDLSNLRFRFHTTNNDLETPNTAVVTVYNLSEQTASKQNLKEYSTLIIDAGYESNHAEIFRGTIKQIRRGKLDNVDSFVEITAADNDLGYNFGTVNTTLAPGVTPQQELKVYADAMGVIVDPSANDAFKETGGVKLNPRGKVMFGLARSYMRDFAYTHNLRWNVENGVLYVFPVSGYLAGEAVKVNSLTGMISIPEATEEGINVRVLLNPRIKIGRAIQLNNRDITQADFNAVFGPGYRQQQFIANTSRDGTYRVLVAEHKGDTRGEEWFTDIVCLNIDVSAPPDASVVAH